ncbi:MAG TPA: hypothetical protein VHD56_08470 [Tepidisphaeraceae bacterium]|nr:hypothetical protein [Tepidisphaeraceae bacterium]
MISTQFAISKTERDLTLGTLLRWTLIVAAVLAVIVQPLFEEWQMVAVGVLVAIGVIWMVLGVGSLRRASSGATSLIAAGEFDLAEGRIADALGSFSLFRMTKLMCLHDLAVLRHAQNRWQESAILCRALLNLRPISQAGIDRSSRLILAESLLELNDLPGVHENLAALYNQRLSLRQALGLMGVQVDYLSRVGEWNQIFAGVATKTELAELLPSSQSARVQALMGLAAQKINRMDWRDWLRRRVELLADVHKLCADRPILWELWRS